MDIQLGSERIFALEDRLGADEVRQRAMDRRSHAFGSGLGSLLQRPKTDDIELVGSQRRLEPFWHVACRGTYVYERTREYAVKASAPEVREVTILGTNYPSPKPVPRPGRSRSPRWSIAGRSSSTRRTPMARPARGSPTPPRS